MYLAPPNSDTAFIDVLSLADKTRKTVAHGGTSPRYLPSGHLIYSNRNTVFAMPFDLATRESRGAPVPVLTDVAYDPAAGLPQMDISRDGTLVYRRNVAREGGASTLAWLDAAGKRQLLRARTARYASTPRLSPDGKKVATTVRDGASQDIWIYDIERDSLTRLDVRYTDVREPGLESGWAIHHLRLDRQRTVLDPRRRRRATPAMWAAERASHFRTRSRPMASASSTTRCPGLHRSGQSRSIRARESGPVPSNICAPRVATPRRRSHPMDGGLRSSRTSRVGSRSDVCPFPASDTGEKRQVSNNGGTWPIWSAKGREILYRSGDQVMAVAYTAAGDSFSPEKPRVVMTTPGTSPGFDVAPDGRVLVMIPTLAAETTTEHTLMFVQNFFDELRRRCRQESSTS